MSPAARRQMGLCGSRAEAPVDDARGSTSVMPSGEGRLTEARLREMYDESDYMTASGYGAVAILCGDEAARRMDEEDYSSDEDSDDDYDRGSDAGGSVLSRQSSTDTLLSSRPSSADSYSSMSSVGSALDDDSVARVSAPGVAAIGKTKHSSAKTFVSERQNF